MNDLEATRLCAAAMGAKSDSEVVPDCKGGYWDHYDPLSEDAQAMALVKKLHLHIDQRPGKQVTVQDPHFEHLVEQKSDLNRAIVYCVAKMRADAASSPLNKEKP